MKSWFLTKDHKRIAILYLVTITFFFLFGGIMAVLIRLELLTPAGGSLPRLILTTSCLLIVMVSFFLAPSIPTTLGISCYR